MELGNFFSRGFVQFYDYYEVSPSEFAEKVRVANHSKLESDIRDFFYCKIEESAKEKIGKFLKREVCVDNYWITRGSGEGYLSEDGGEYFYSDSPFYYLLREGKEIGAICGFLPREDGILINQIQGFFGKRDVWGNIRYPDLFIDVCWDMVLRNEIGSLMVLPYFNNKWKDVRENYQNTKRRQYDQPAKRAGFVYDKKKGVYIKNNKI